MSDDSGLERRQATRAAVSLSIEVRQGRGFSIHATRDVSVGGVFFDRAIPHGVGTKVQLAFELPGDSHVIRCEGEVVNVPDKTGYGMGVRFGALAPDDLTRLGDFVREMTGEEP